VIGSRSWHNRAVAANRRTREPTGIHGHDGRSWMLVPIKS
jgi:hypothetical protein